VTLRTTLAEVDAFLLRAAYVVSIPSSPGHAENNVQLRIRPKLTRIADASCLCIQGILHTSRAQLQTATPEATPVVTPTPAPTVKVGLCNNGGTRGWLEKVTEGYHPIGPFGPSVRIEVVHLVCTSPRVCSTAFCFATTSRVRLETNKAPECQIICAPLRLSRSSH
jgi:hypothetical protein